ncbi:MAG: hypothetical protein K1W20_04955 [Lachnospiraceae bacterium]
MSKSIMQDKETGECYLCRLLHKDYSIKLIREEHHVMGGVANRKLSEKYGLKVYLDIEHHRYGPEAVHRNAEVAKLLHREAQKAFERTYPGLNFREVFGKNYLTDSERAYERDPRFRLYVNRYSANHRISVDEALRHELVDQVRQEYEGK